MSDKTSDVGEKGVEEIEALQSQVLDDQGVAEDLRYRQQSLIRYELVTNQEQAGQYIRDLQAQEINDIQDNREKALHLYGFYKYMEEKKEADAYIDNFIKVFQLAIFYDDNYVYRYYLAKEYFARGERERAKTQIEDCVAKVKSREVSLYGSLAKEVNPQVLRNEINELLIRLSLPTLDVEG
jgi:hypothetical protein